jgi:hypothetical protein
MCRHIVVAALRGFWGNTVQPAACCAGRHRLLLLLLLPVPTMFSQRAGPFFQPLLLLLHSLVMPSASAGASRGCLRHPQVHTDTHCPAAAAAAGCSATAAGPAMCTPAAAPLLQLSRRPCPALSAHLAHKVTVHGAAHVAGVLVLIGGGGEVEQPAQARLPFCEQRPAQLRLAGVIQALLGQLGVVCVWGGGGGEGGVGRGSSSGCVVCGWGRRFGEGGRKWDGQGGKGPVCGCCGCLGGGGEVEGEGGGAVGGCCWLQGGSQPWPVWSAATPVPVRCIMKKVVIG